MLLELRIANFALIDRAEIAPGPGFNVLTGETGAGKSILIQALGLLLGERAAAEQVGNGELGKAFIEGAFDLVHVPRARDWLNDNDFECDGVNLIISREVTTDGRSRVRLNGRLATATALREFGDLLVDLHGQHEHQLLLRPEAHLAYLDASGDARHAALREALRSLHARWRDAVKRLDDLSRSEATRAQRLDLLRFQTGEIDAAELEAGEDDRLQEERVRLVNSEKLRSAATLCRDALLGQDDPGAVSLARQALAAAKEIATVDDSVGAWLEELQSAIFELEDAASEARAYADGLEADPARLEEIEARLHAIGRLRRKYGASATEILAYREQIGMELEELGFSEAALAGLTQEVAGAERAYHEAAAQLSLSRRELAVGFTGAVVEQLKDLAMPHARLEVGFESGAPSADGADRVEFLFAANPGQTLRPLARIASGGEISRVMLGLRSVLRHRGDDAGVPIVIFDEIDSGIGGLTAEAVGEKMQEIARDHQVFCITHLPQIAKRADFHFRVEKSSESERTRVDVVPLEGEERVRELARMMGSESAANLEHARVLLLDAAARS